MSLVLVTAQGTPENVSIKINGTKLVDRFCFLFFFVSPQICGRSRVCNKIKRRPLMWYLTNNPLFDVCWCGGVGVKWQVYEGERKNLKWHNRCTLGQMGIWRNCQNKIDSSDSIWQTISATNCCFRFSFCGGVGGESIAFYAFWILCEDIKVHGWDNERIKMIYTLG